MFSAVPPLPRGYRTANYDWWRFLGRGFNSSKLFHFFCKRMLCFLHYLAKAQVDTDGCKFEREVHHGTSKMIDRHRRAEGGCG